MHSKILIVDDNRILTEIIGHRFRMTGHDCRTAGDGEAALALVRQDPPDLIILDVMMPNRNGYQVCRELKSAPRTSGIPILILTARGQKQDRVWARDAGADDIMVKPFEMEELEKRVEELLRKSALRSAKDTLDPEGYVPLDEEIEALRRRGEPFASVEFALDGRALEVFEQKYGPPAAASLVGDVERSLRRIVGELDPTARIDASSDGRFTVVMSAVDGMAEALRAAATDEVRKIIRAAHTPEDLARGSIVLPRPGGASPPEEVPLLALECLANAGGSHRR